MHNPRDEGKTKMPPDVVLTYTPESSVKGPPTRSSEISPLWSSTTQALIKRCSRGSVGLAAAIRSTTEAVIERCSRRSVGLAAAICFPPIKWAYGIP
ncbi:hypothetical protein AAMO2058_001319100 [Amorphochlora amoebiformis]